MNFCEASIHPSRHRQASKMKERQSWNSKGVEGGEKLHTFIKNNDGKVSAL